MPPWNHFVSPLSITSTDTENHKSCKDRISILFHLCIQTKPVSASLYSARRNSQMQQAFAPVEKNQGIYFQKAY